ncbi:MAG: zinc-binding alcohol dehydrogenase [Gammaproteobacteria bacterium]|nr:zinc-binding alcohol dehydrogenase [Gammaproteobacteria bacterium]
MPKRIIFPEKGKVVLEAFDLSSLGSEDVRVRTLYSLMSIGTETVILHQRYDPDTHFAKIFSFPQLKTGVQAVGIVEATGSAVSDFSVGDRIFMRMAHGSHQVVPAEACSPVPDGIDPKLACWCGLAKTAFRAAWAGPFVSGSHVLVIGAGPVGQMAVRWAKSEGVETIAIVDLSEFRLSHAENGGATMIIQGDVADQVDAIRGIGGGNGPPVIVDTTGNPNVFKHALSAAPMFGKVILLGDTGYPSRQCLSSDMMTKGLTVQAVHDSHDRDGWIQRKIDEKFFDRVANGRFDLSGLITHEFSPEDCAKAYALADEQREQVTGILYEWGDVD